MYWPDPHSPLEQLQDEIFLDAGVKVFVKRDDLLDPFVSGNKFRKLKYNLLEASEKRLHTLLTFGGAYSNHLYAVAKAGERFGFQTIGVVRGDELEPASSPTLQSCAASGMQLHFVSRTDFRRKEQMDLVRDISGMQNPMIIPEGGSNDLAVKGVSEIGAELAAQLNGLPDHVITAAGTGGTAAGLLSAGLHVVAVSALKGDFLRNEILSLAQNPSVSQNLTVVSDYHFGGYAKTTDELFQFIRNFESRHRIPLEQVYTGKACFALFDLIRSRYFKRGSKIVFLHTGGLQGRSPEL